MLTPVLPIGRCCFGRVCIRLMYCLQQTPCNRQTYANKQMHGLSPEQSGYEGIMENGSWASRYGLRIAGCGLRVCDRAR